MNNYTLIFAFIICLIVFVNFFFFYRRTNKNHINIFVYLLCFNFLYILSCLLRGIFPNNDLLNLLPNIFDYTIIILFFVYINEYLKKGKSIISYGIILFITVIYLFLFIYTSLNIYLNPKLISIYHVIKNIPLLTICFIITYYILFNIKNNQKFNMHILSSLIFIYIGITQDLIFPTFIFPFFSSISILLLYLEIIINIANIDALTGLYNRRFLDYRYLNSYSSTNKKLGVFVIDIDNFKLINDHYGHAQGDIILKSIRSTDVAIRTGGDEFTIIANVKNKSDLNIIYKNLNNNLNLFNINENSMNEPLELSIGYDIYNNLIPLNDFINTLDKQMYKNKKNKK